jgi:KDO2-lipid IV(A) lauroyltransferase
MKGKELRRRIRIRTAAALPPVLARLPEPLGREFCAGAGWAAHWLVARDRRLARKNLALVHRDWDAARVRREAREVFLEIGRNVYDFVRYPELGEAGKDRLVEVAGREHLDRIRGRGALLVTAHWGSFEVLAAHLTRMGYPLTALARPLREAGLDALLVRHRRRMGVATFASTESPRRAVRHLRSGGMLGVLIDHRIRKGGVTVQFFGRPTRVTDGPARLALATGCPILPLGIRRLENNRHRITVRPPLPTPGSGDRVTALTQAAVGALEEMIRTAPRQWIWIHPRWEESAGVPSDNGTSP